MMWYMRTRERLNCGRHSQCRPRYLARRRSPAGNQQGNSSCDDDEIVELQKRHRKMLGRQLCLV